MKRGVELGRDRSYWFPILPEALWSTLAETGDYRSWWPSLTDLEADRLVAGAVWHCTIRPPLPFALRLAIHLDDVLRPTLVTANISGDIAGTARLDVEPHGKGCDVQLTSTLAPSNRTLGTIETLARPIIRRAYNWMLDTGARQFLNSAIAERGPEAPRSTREVRAKRSVARAAAAGAATEPPTPDPFPM
jgi:hypothetical protein